MKNFLIFLFIFAIFVEHARSATQTSTFDRLNRVRPQNSDDCDNDKAFKANNLKNFPAKTLKKMTIAFTFSSSNRCVALDRRLLLPLESNIFGLSITQGDVTKKLIELVNVGSSTKVYTTDASNTRLEVSSQDRDSGIQRVAISIDLEKGLISNNIMTSEAYNAQSKSEVSYGTLSIDNTMSLNFVGTESFSDIIIEYEAYYSEKDLFSFVTVPSSPEILSAYTMNEKSGLVVKDSQESGFGAMYLGTNKQGTSVTDEAINPTWTSNGLGFTKTTQYASVILPQPFYGNDADNNEWITSAGFSFWIKLDQVPATGTTQTIVKSTYSASDDGLTVSLNDAAKVVASYDGTAIATTKDALPLGQWTLVTVNIGSIGSTARLAIMYFGSTLETETSANFFYAPAPTPTPIPMAPGARRLGAADGDFRIQIGGFIGEMHSLLVLSPGASRVNYPSSKPGCSIDYGLDSQVCLVSNEIKLDEDGLSAGEIVAIVLGSLAFLAVLGGVIFFISRKFGKSDDAKRHNAYKIPSSPHTAMDTEAAPMKSI